MLNIFRAVCPSVRCAGRSLIGSLGPVRGAKKTAADLDFDDVHNLGHAMGVKYETEEESQLDAAALSIELACVMNHQGRYANAETMQLSAINIQMKYLGESLVVSKSLEKHAETLRYLKRLPDAEKMLKKALDMRYNLVGPWDSDFYQASQALIEVLQEQGKLDEVEDILYRRHEIDWQVWNHQHMRLGISLGNQANHLFEEQKYLDAEDAHRVAIQVRKSVLGPDDLDVAKSMNNLACTLLKQSKQDEALTLQNSAVRLFKSLLEGDHPDVIVAQANLAVALRMNNEFVHAESLQRHVVNRMTELFVEDDLYVANALNNLAYVLVGRKVYDEAMILYDHALERMMDWYKAEHREMSDIVQSKACILVRQNKLDDAEKMYQRACDLRRMGSPVKHLTGNSDEDVLVMLRTRGKYRKTLNKHNNELGKVDDSDGED